MSQELTIPSPRSDILTELEVTKYELRLARQANEILNLKLKVRRMQTYKAARLEEDNQNFNLFLIRAGSLTEEMRNWLNYFEDIKHSQVRQENVLIKEAEFLRKNNEKIYNYLEQTMQLLNKQKENREGGINDQ